jgi:hypothetical protein
MLFGVGFGWLTQHQTNLHTK